MADSEVPEAITATITDLNERIDGLRGQQHIDSAVYGHLCSEAANVRARLDQRKERIRALKGRRRTLLFATACIRGEFVYVSEARTEPFIIREVEVPSGLKTGDETERVSDAPVQQPASEGAAQMDEQKWHSETSEKAVQAMRDLGAAKPADIRKKAGLDSAQIGPALSALSRNKMAQRLSDGRWELLQGGN